MAYFFFGHKRFCRLREALEGHENAAVAGNDVDLVIVPPEPAAEIDEDRNDDSIEDRGVNDVWGTNGSVWMMIALIVNIFVRSWYF